MGFDFVKKVETERRMKGCRTRERKMTGRRGSTRGPGRLLIDGRGALLLAEEVQGRVEREAAGVQVGGLIQHEGEACIIIVGDGHGTGSLVEGRPPRFAVVHCLGVTDPGQRKATTENGTVSIGR
jgi:hypothetical protein